jgi:hypothetical protein
MLTYAPDVCSEQNCGAGYVTGGLKCDSNAVACGTASLTQTSNNGATCAHYVLPSLILDLGVGKETRVDMYRFATTTLDPSFNYEPSQWVLEGIRSYPHLSSPILAYPHLSSRTLT